MVNSKLYFTLFFNMVIKELSITRVLKNYKDYTLSGDEAEVLGTSSTPQTVRTVSS